MLGGSFGLASCLLVTAHRFQWSMSSRRTRSAEIDTAHRIPAKDFVPTRTAQAEGCCVRRCRHGTNRDRTRDASLRRDRTRRLKLGLLGEDPFDPHWNETANLTVDEMVEYVSRRRERNDSQRAGTASPVPNFGSSHWSGRGSPTPRRAERPFIVRGTVNVHLSRVFAELAPDVRPRADVDDDRGCRHRPRREARSAETRLRSAPPVDHGDTTLECTIGSDSEAGRRPATSSLGRIRRDRGWRRPSRRRRSRWQARRPRSGLRHEGSRRSVVRPSGRLR